MMSLQQKSLIAKSNITRTLIILLSFISASLLTECTYDTIIVDDIGNVSFSGDLIPLFSANCAVNCHEPGGVYALLDLTPTQAYDQLTSQNLVNTSDPAASTLYKEVNVGGEMSDYIGSSRNRQLILKWIEQGALDN